MDTRERQTTAASHDSDSPPALVDFRASGWARAVPATVAHDQQARLRARRDALSRAFPGDYLVVPVGGEQVRANDTNFVIASSDIATCWAMANRAACSCWNRTASGHRTLLFVPAHNRGEASTFTDRVTASSGSGVIAASTRAVPTTASMRHAASARSMRTCRRARAGHSTRALPDDVDLATHLSEMRLIRMTTGSPNSARPSESPSAIRRRHPQLPYAKSEREFEAAFWRRARIEANDVGYLTIAASGHHACTLHWNRNDGILDKSALLLLDAGVECDSLYTADVTRTLPLSGTFSHEQRAVYDIVYEAQRVAIDAVAPGNDFLEPNRRAMRVLAEGLVELGVLKCSVDEALDPQNQFYRRYTLHNVSHMLGIDVHDCAKARGELPLRQPAEGMVPRSNRARQPDTRPCRKRCAASGSHRRRYRGHRDRTRELLGDPSGA